MSEKKIEVDGIEIDVKKVRILLTKILVAEKTNIATREKTDAQMSSYIKKKIEEEVQCC